MFKDSMEMAMYVSNILSEKKAMDIKILDIREISPIADYFVIVTGISGPHIKALADEVDEKMELKGCNFLHKEGYQGGRWVLMDYADVVVHIFIDEERKFYSLEKVWGDAKIITLQE